ncbi:hypothetical protein ALI22I_20560 [Saccharothrix sp. ALI-22-I]|uniref:hypothetical protein n=1 Tax=Saccharothrix sp. ALI-22-I TaxID=1933778 RepID=UPI00097C63A1|nr:hypothetical protein [Saccharothrix sp. ALI-22-I]ONI88132.1 hypothetical protein ALI22I_20560 [Saccharothrix sp. ALI-22-I]
MPRLPKNFTITGVFIESATGCSLVPTGRNSAVPADFRAHVQVTDPAVAVSVGIHVDVETGPRVYELSVRSARSGPVTTTVLRQVLVDQVLRAAMAEAAVDVGPGVLAALVEPTVDPRLRPGLRREDLPDLDAATAAEIYSAAVAAGSPRPGIVVASRMNRSRSQVARYIRRARELGLLPPLRRGAVTSP